MQTMENYLSVQTSSGLMDVFVSSPVESGFFPVIVLFQEAFGVNGHIKDVAQRLSHNGYVVLAPELYHRLGRHLTLAYQNKSQIMSLMSQLKNEDIMEDLWSTLELAKQLPHADLGIIFTCGFCVGGFSSFLSSLVLKCAGHISFYGAGVTKRRKGLHLEPFSHRFNEIRSPLLLFYGEADASIPQFEVKEVEKELLLAGKAFDLTLFVGADHGFFCDQRKSFHQQAASEAWRKLLRWLDLRTQDWKSERKFRPLTKAAFGPNRASMGLDNPL
jgi:carboxymethylenebutenolidase